MTNPMLVRSLTPVATPVANSSRAEAHRRAFRRLTSRYGRRNGSRLLFPPRPAFHEGRSGPVPAVVLGSSEGWTVEDNGPDGARQIRRDSGGCWKARPLMRGAASRTLAVLAAAVAVGRRLGVTLRSAMSARSSG